MSVRPPQLGNDLAPTASALASSTKTKTSTKRLAFQATDEVFIQEMTSRARTYDGDPRPYKDS
eukprot:14734437-Heterocapsa_arctica.AAC.1